MCNNRKDEYIFSFIFILHNICIYFLYLHARTAAQIIPNKNASKQSDINDIIHDSKALKSDGATNEHCHF